MIYKILKSIYRFLVSLQRGGQRKYWSWRARMAAGSYATAPNVAFRSTFSPQTHLGRNTNFNGMHIAGSGKVTIGDNFHSGRDCKMITSYHNFDKGTHLPYDRTMIHKTITIEDNVWLGDHVLVLGGVTIGEGAVIQAGSVVARNVPKYAIAGGHPAVAFKYRDKEHYERLKAAGKFI